MMEVVRLKSKETSTNGIFIRLDKTDALKLIESLAYQMHHNNPNVNRKEWCQIKNKLGWNYLTIAVVPDAKGK